MKKIRLIRVASLLLIWGLVACQAGGPAEWNFQGGTEATNPHQFRSVAGRILLDGSCEVDEVVAISAPIENAFSLQLSSDCTFKGLVHVGDNYGLQLVVADQTITVFFPLNEVEFSATFSVPAGHGDIDLGTIVINWAENENEETVAYAEEPVMEFPAPEPDAFTVDTPKSSDSEDDEPQTYQLNNPIKGPVTPSGRSSNARIKPGVFEMIRTPK